MASLGRLRRPPEGAATTPSRNVLNLRTQDRRNSLREFSGGHLAGGIAQDEALAHGKLKKRTNGRQLTRHRGFFQIVVVQIRDEFANHQVRYIANARRLHAGRRKKRQELPEVILVAAKGMWRSVAHSPQIFKILLYFGFHVPTSA